MPITAKCLSPAGVGLFDDNDNLTTAARDSFTTQVVALLTSGNANGLGAKISSIINIPFPPPSGVKLFDPDRLLTNPFDPLGDLFWFDPSPFAPLTYDVLRDPEGGYQKIIVDSLYAPLMKVLNMAGDAAAKPIVDYTGFLPPDLAAKLVLPDDLIKISVAGLNVPALKALGIDLGDITKFAANLGALNVVGAIPTLPPIPTPEFDFIVFPGLFEALVTLPVTLLPDLLGELSADPPALFSPDPPALFGLVLKVVFPAILDILKKIGLLAILPKLLVATFIVMIQNAVIGLLCMVVSQIIGTGQIVKTIGTGLGLV